MAKLRTLGIWFAAKLCASLAAFVGLLAGIAYSVGGAAYDIATTHSVNVGTALAFLALIGMPALFSAAGFVVGALGAPLYNAVARRFGGIHLDIGTN